MHSEKLEFLALKWAVTEKFRPYLYHAPSFNIHTDNNPLTYINTTAKLNATSHRWVAELADYNFKLHYHPGKASTDVDFLSRLPHDIVSLMSECSEETSLESVKATILAASAMYQQDFPWITALSDQPRVFDKEVEFTKLAFKPLSKQALLQAQWKDSAISQVVKYKSLDRELTKEDCSSESEETKALMREWKTLRVGKDGLLRRTSSQHEQLVLPKELQPLVYQHLHCDLGHLGSERVCNLAHQWFFWPRMQRDIEHYITRVCQCVKQK